VNESHIDSRERDVTVVAFHGDLDIVTASAVSAELAEVDPTSDVVVDLGRTTFVDSVTLSCFIVASRRHHRHGARFVLADAQGAVRRVLAITGLDHAMEYADSVPEARHQMTTPDQSAPTDDRPDSEDDR
jgi:anti-sigma B factor antagonist